MIWPVDEPLDGALEQHDQVLEDHELHVQHRDRARETSDAAARCWHCGGTGVRCCEFSRDLRADEHRAAADLYSERSGTVTPAPIAAPVHVESRKSVA